MVLFPDFVCSSVCFLNEKFRKWCNVFLCYQQKKSTSAHYTSKQIFLYRASKLLDLVNYYPIVLAHAIRHKDPGEQFILPC